ncbi:energy transducer TonB [Pedobacter polaris]|uniref:Energy transducer TonB n=1 Tax=Pedobacter polaris TaxID=2571273 RepID=A0A4V5NZ24_9SPHI|nr:energy transducer TonB [Pedobacter polaris]TKC06626.1 energy transducer TonB [Pedobacter polaris]
MFNNSSSLYNSEWLALVFSNRNKNYGAYVLRTESSNIMVRALLIVVPVFVMLFVGPMIYAQLKPATDTAIQVTIDTQDPNIIHDMEKIEPKKEEAKKELPKAKPIIEQAKSINMSANLVVTDKPVAVEPPTTAEVETAVIASVTTEGVEGKGNSQPTESTTGGGGGNGTAEVADNIIYTVDGLEKFPEFPGGMAAWSKFIQKNLRYPYMAQETGVQGKVYISFVVEKDGSVSNVSLMRGIGAGCDEEAIRVIKKSPKWIPGIQNKSSVRVRYNMPINYTISQ